MLLSNLFPTTVLMEAKARIEHPEDMIFDHGVRGAQTALQILQTTAEQPHSISVKFDGSPSLIMGWRNGEFILTDKAGFSAKSYDGMTTSAQAVHDMIMARKFKDVSDQAVQRRRAYAQTIASIYPILQANVPPDFQGFAQGDLMWVGRPELVDGFWEFQPNKIKYRVHKNTDLGRQIAHSTVGIVIHSVYGSQSDSEPQALRDVRSLGFGHKQGLVIVPHEIKLDQPLKLNSEYEHRVIKLIRDHEAQIQRLFNPLALADQNIRAMPVLMKSFMAYKAGQGSSTFDTAAEEFLSWLFSPASKASISMQKNVIAWIEQNLPAYNAVWHIVQYLVDLKLDLKRQMDQQVGDVVSAQLDDQPGHEGFVSVTPEGIIKFVNRAEFMKKDDTQPLAESDQHQAVFTFARANPPTKGHKMVMDRVGKQAAGGDYWLFFSHSQDAKKNPLSWTDKIDFVKRMMPRHAAHVYDQPNVRTPLAAADWLYNQGYRKLVMVVGSDRVDDMTNLLHGWNSADIRAKYNRDPVEIQVVSAGERDPDAEGISGISGTRARAAVKNNDFKDFEISTGLSGDIAHQLFDAVKLGMQPAVKKTSTMVAEHDHSSGTIVKLRMQDQCARALRAWCDQNNIDCMDPHDLHLTLIYSVRPVPELMSLDATVTNLAASIQGWRILGEGVLTLELNSPELVRMHDRMLSMGAQHSWPDFIPHTSVCYKWDQSVCPQTVPDFDLVFEAVEVEPVISNWSAMR